MIHAIRNTARQLAKDDQYQWGHMGACNCGFLAQEVTRMNKDAIHRCAMEGHGDWSEQLNDYCPTSGLKMDQLISELIAFGFEPDDLKHLERLSDTCITRKNASLNDLHFNVKKDVIAYMNCWADHLEECLLEPISIRETIDEVSQLNNVSEQESKSEIKECLLV